MKHMLAVAAVFVTVVSMAFCVTKATGRPVLSDAGDETGPAMPAAEIPYMIRLDGLEKSSQSGITSTYVITNLGSAQAATLHEFFDESAQSWQYSTSLDQGEARIFELAEIPNLPNGYQGYVIVLSDQPITGTVVPPSYDNYLPLVILQPAPTPIPPTPTPVPGPLPIGETIHFEGAWEDVPLEGKVVFSEYRNVLVDDYSGPVYPGGVFVVVLMDVTNHGLTSDEVGRYGSFKVRDSVGRQFDIAELEVLWAAEDEYGYDSVYEAIQPGFTRRLVFVFDVLPASEDLHVISLSPW